MRAPNLPIVGSAGSEGALQSRMAPPLSTETAMEELDEIFSEFLIEANEVLDQFDRDMVELEKDPSSRTLLDGIFRGIHTIKGTSGVLGLDKLVSISHVGETLLCRMRDGEMRLTPESTTALLAMSDALRQLLGAIAASGSEGDGDFSGLIGLLTALLDPQHAPPAPVAADPLIPAGNQAMAAPADDASPPHAFPDPPAETAPSAPVKSEPAREQKDLGNDALGNTIRVDVTLLDKLMNLVGELVLARNQIMQLTSVQTEPALTGAAQRLSHITSELQSSVMKTRMQPIGTIWHKLPRLLRDLARGCGKEVELITEGAETELDRTILEAIKDPLTHVIRNAVDHGIEPPDLRARNGKHPAGQLTLRAYHEGGKVNIEIRDDGAGVNLDAVKRKALERRLIQPGDAERMSEREMLSLIFQPGFSTAQQVTNISGRGVGMDVVKTNITKIGGTIDLQSTPGQGTTLTIKIPLTLAIIPALIVTTASNRFAIPQVSLVELVRLEGEAAAHAIEYIHNTPVYRLRGALLPILYLDQELGAAACQTKEEGQAITIVVLQTENNVFGLVVDEVNDSEEIVVKPLGNLLRGLSCYAGATIMGDGRVALILDVMGLAQKARVVGEQRTRTTETVVEKTQMDMELESWLLADLGGARRVAIPLDRVHRLEEFPAAAMEWSGNQTVIQYRGEIMPMISVAQLLGVGRISEPAATMQATVVSRGDRRYALLVDRIVDIVEQQIVVDPSRKTALCAGSAVIEEHVTDVLDIEGILDASLIQTAELLTAQAESC